MWQGRKKHGRQELPGAFLRQGSRFLPRLESAHAPVSNERYRGCCPPLTATPDARAHPGGSSLAEKLRRHGGAPRPRRETAETQGGRPHRGAAQARRGSSESSSPGVAQARRGSSESIDFVYFWFYMHYFAYKSASVYCWFTNGIDASK